MDGMRIAVNFLGSSKLRVAKIRLVRTSFETQRASRKARSVVKKVACSVDMRVPKRGSSLVVVSARPP